jgi:hypothetical protein
MFHQERCLALPHALARANVYFVAFRHQDHDPSPPEYALVDMLEIQPANKQEPTQSKQPVDNITRDPFSTHSAAENGKVGTVRARDKSPPQRRDTPDGDAELEPQLQARQMRARERVVILRGRVQRTRRIKSKRREELRPLREEVGSATGRLIKRLYELDALGSLPSELLADCERFRVAHDALGPAENAFDMLEIRLDQEEEDLEEEEDHFYRHYNVLSEPDLDSNLDTALSPLAEPYNPSDVDIQEINLVPEQLREYLQLKERAETLKTEMLNLEEEYYRCVEEEKFRMEHRVSISAETTTFLANYAKIHLAIVADLDKAEEELFTLREECVELHLFEESDYIYEQHDALSRDIWDAVEDARDRSPLRVAANDVDYFERETRLSDKKNTVNSWLLDWIRDSSINVLALKAWLYSLYPDIPSKDEYLLENDNWAGLALKFWDTDSAGAYTDRNYNASRLDAIAGDTLNLGLTSTGPSRPPSRLSETPHSLHVSLEGARSFDHPIMGSEANSYTTQRADAPQAIESQPSNSLTTVSLEIPPGNESSGDVVIIRNSSSKESESETEFNNKNRNHSLSHMTAWHSDSQHPKGHNLQVPFRHK